MQVPQVLLLIYVNHLGLTSFAKVALLKFYRMCHTGRRINNIIIGMIILITNLNQVVSSEVVLSLGIPLSWNSLIISSIKRIILEK